MYCILLVVQVVVCHGLEVEGLDPPGEARQELQAGGVAGSESGEEDDFYNSKYRFFKNSLQNSVKMKTISYNKDTIFDSRVGVGALNLYPNRIAAKIVFLFNLHFPRVII